MLLFIKEFFERVDFGKKSADIKIATNINQHAKSVSLKCVLERCETAIKTNSLQPIISKTPRKWF